MPFTTEQQDEILKKNGLDPASHFMDLQTGDIYKKPTVNQPQAQPSFEAPSSQELTTRPDQKPMSMAEAMSVQLKGAMLPFGTGAVGGALGTRSAMGLGARLGVGGGPIGVGIGAILGGIGGSLGGEYLQNKSILSPEFQAKRAQADEQWPLVSAGTRLLPNAITTNVRQSVKDLGTLAKALVKTPEAALNVARPVLTSAGKAAIANAGVNVGVAGGMEAYNERQKYLQAQEAGVPYEPNKLAIAANILIPSLLSTPRAWYSKAMGFKPTGEAPTSLDTTGSESAASRAALEGRVPKIPRPETTLPAGIKVRESKIGNTLSFVDTSLPMNHLFKYKGDDYITVKGDVFKNKEGKELRRVTARKLAPAEDVAPTVAEGYNDRSSNRALEEDIATYEALSAKTRKLGLEGFGTPEGQEVRRQVEELKNKYEGFAPKDYAAEVARRAAAAAEKPDKPLTQEEIKQALEASTPEEIAKLTREQKLERAYQQHLPFNAPLAEKRGVGVITDPNLQKAGQVSTDIKDRTVTTGPAGLRGPGTIPHEVAHKHLRDLAFSDAKLDQNLVKKLEDQYGFKLLTNEGELNEESLVKIIEKMAIDYNRTYGSKKDRAVQAFKAIRDQWQYRFGNADKDVTTRVYADRLQHHLHQSLDTPLASGQL